MKKFYAVLVGLCTVLTLHAVVDNALPVTPGGLSSLVEISDRPAITSLTLTGSIDARDFKSMRDSFPALENVDISGVSIDSYKGVFGTGTGTGEEYYSKDHIPHRAFLDKVTLKRFLAPTDIKAIGNNAFRNCVNLKGSFNVPNNVTSIGSYVFSGCAKLTEVILHDQILEIGFYAFENCTGISAINLAEGLNSIGDSAFRGCVKLTAVTVPSTVTKLGSSAFRGCIRLKSILIEAALTKIENNMFRGDTALIGTIGLPETITSIEKSAFEKCDGLDTLIIPQSVVEIGDKAFANCSGLKYINLPSSLSYIASDLFLNDSMLVSVEIPFLIDSIGAGAFRNCVALQKIVIPDVNSIGENAFRSCLGLDTIFAIGREPVDLTNASNVFHFVDTATCLLVVPFKSIEAYKTASKWEAFLRSEEAISFNVDTVIASANGATVDDVAVSSGFEWTVVADSSWTTVSPSSAAGDKTISFTVSENRGDAARATRISFLVYNLFEETITLNQKASPVISWDVPATLSAGTVLSETLLNATSSIAGTFSYTPAAGQMLVPGEGQTLSVTFNPSDTINYSPITYSTSINVGRVTPEIEITYSGDFVGGTMLSEAMFSTDTELLGTLSADPAFGSVLTTGEDQLIKITFTPDDTVVYAPVVKEFTVGVVAPEVTFDASQIDIDGFDQSKGELIVTTNTTWSIAINETWVTPSKTTSTGTDTITFVATSNTTGSDRSATITFSAEGMDDVVITVVQKPEGESGVGNITADNISLYPNPVVEQFAVSGFEGEAVVTVIDLTGKAILKRTVVADEKLTVSELLSGIYIVYVETAIGHSTLKIVKK